VQDALPAGHAGTGLDHDPIKSDRIMV